MKQVYYIEDRILEDATCFWRTLNKFHSFDEAVKALRDCIGSAEVDGKTPVVVKGKEYRITKLYSWLP